MSYRIMRKVRAGIVMYGSMGIVDQKEREREREIEREIERACVFYLLRGRKQHQHQKGTCFISCCMFFSMFASMESFE